MVEFMTSIRFSPPIGCVRSAPDSYKKDVIHVHLHTEQAKSNEDGDQSFHSWKYLC